MNTMNYEDRAEAIAERLELVITRGRAVSLLKSIAERHAEGREFALDFETVGLIPELGQVRLSVLYDIDAEKVYILDHYFCGTFRALFPYYIDTAWYVYNSKFEVRWFDHVARGQVTLFDVDFMRKCCTGGWPSSLAKMIKYDLGVDVSKDLQKSDWGRKELTTAQYRYAALDGVYTGFLVRYWHQWIVDNARDLDLTDDIYNAMETMDGCVRPTVECEDTGLTLDIPLHQISIDRWARKQEIAFKRVRNWTPPEMISNLNSNKQVSDFLKGALPKETIALWPKTEKTEQLKLEQKVVRPFARRLGYPISRWLNAFCSYRYYAKYLSTYGDTLVTKQRLAGVVNYRLNIAQAATGRYSSSSINVQNLPRAKYVRRAFRPPPGYDLLVVADYSSIEVRVLAELSGDKALIHDAIHGDVHATMAAARMRIEVALFRERLAQAYPRYGEYRSKAKVGTFRLTYGAGAGAIADSMGCSYGEAEEFMRLWAEKYPDAYNYRMKMNGIMMRTKHLPVVSGRRIFVPRGERTIPIAANYPIQGAAADVMMEAMTQVYSLRDEESSPEYIKLCATVHDELILAAKHGHEKKARSILVRGMEVAWLNVFPDTDVSGLVEGGIGETWGDAK